MTEDAEDGIWRLNYFNYFTEVEEQFQRSRATGLFLLSPLDWALIESWKKRGHPPGGGAAWHPDRLRPVARQKAQNPDGELADLLPPGCDERGRGDGEEPTLHCRG